MVPRKRERTAIAGGERLVLAAVAALPDRSHGVDDVPGRQTVALGDFGVPGRAAAEAAAFSQKIRSGGPVNRAVDPSAAKQRVVRCIDDGVDIQRRDVGDDDFILRRADLSYERRQAEAGALRVMPLSANSFCNSPAWNISRTMSQPPTNSPLT